MCPCRGVCCVYGSREQQECASVWDGDMGRSCVFVV